MKRIVEGEWDDVMGEMLVVVVGGIFRVSLYRDKDGFRICWKGERS